jgi:hypothetical protein
VDSLERIIQTARAAGASILEIGPIRVTFLPYALPSDALAPNAEGKAAAREGRGALDPEKLEPDDPLLDGLRPRRT